MKPWKFRYCAALCSILLLLPQNVFCQTVVEQISFQGLKKTRVSYAGRFLQSKVGEIYNTDEVAADEQSLRNLQLFANVSSRLEERDGRTTLIFIVEERITRLPITNFGGITDNFWFQLGINDFNWLGQGGYFGGYYQYYDRHSFKLFSMMPYVLGDRWGLSYVIGRQATLEPAYFANTATDFEVDRWEFTGLLRYELVRNLATQNIWTLSAGGGYLNEIYIQPTSSDLDFPARSTFEKYFFRTILEHHKLNYYNHYIDGNAQMLTLEFVETVGNNRAFWKWLNEFRFFWHLGRHANPAIRVIAGISSKDDSPFVPFVLDSYLNVRGSGNRVARGTSELTVNLEHRQTLFEANQWAFEGVVFLDASAWRPGSAPLHEMFYRENIVSFIGAGARLHWRKIYNFSLRLDYGTSTTSASKGFVLGVGQYF